jgi:tetratricopeptide (TPR) repeat protein
MTSKCIRRIGYGVGVLALAVALFYAEEDWRGHKAWQQFKQQSEASGERFELAIPPAVPDDQNFALAPIVASAYETYIDEHGNRLPSFTNSSSNRLVMSLYYTNDFQHIWPNDRDEGPTNLSNWRLAKFTDLAAWQKYYRNPPSNRTTAPRAFRGSQMGSVPKIQTVTATNPFPISPQPQSPAADVLLALSRYDSVLEELRQASKLPGVRFAFRYDTADLSFKILFPGIGAFAQCAQILSLRADAELAEGHSDKALQDIQLVLRLAQMQTGTVWPRRAGMMFVNVALQAAWEGMAAHQWSDAQLVALDSELSKLDFLAEYRREVRGHRACSFDQMNCIRARSRNGPWFPKTEDNGFNEPEPIGDLLVKACYCLAPSGWWDQNRLASARAYQQALSQIDPDKRVVSKDRARPFSIIEDRSDTPHPTRMLAQATYDAVPAEKFAYAQTELDLARVACALECCRIASGDYPSSLDQLIPRFMPQLPHDVIDGAPLRYRNEGQGHILLYSIGWNGVDDHGRVMHGYRGGSGIDITLGDWVWRYHNDQAGTPH